jgi:hypothetical protein
MSNTPNGKWTTHEVPLTGWDCVDFEDLGRIEQICEMCETKEIRYVHYMAHPDIADRLKVGCVCAGHMSRDYVGANRREQDAKNAAGRRRRWLDRNWRWSAKGNLYLKTTDGFRVTVYGDAPNLKVCVADDITGKTVFSQRSIRTTDEARLAGFDEMIRRKGEWRRRP